MFGISERKIDVVGGYAVAKVWAEREMARARTNSALNGGFYTVSEAARLLNLESTRSVLRWLSPTAAGASPVIIRQYEKLGSQHEIGFLDLLEVRFVEHFRRQKISLQSLRVAAKHAREELKVEHPFATSNVKFQTDRKAIFLESAKETGDRIFLNLMTKQLEMYGVIEQIIAKDLEFDVGGLARSWMPARNEAPNVIVSPAFAFGRPVIGKRRVPTAALFQTWSAEGGDYDVAAKWHRVDVEIAREAVEFEMSLAA